MIAPSFNRATPAHGIGTAESVILFQDKVAADELNDHLRKAGLYGDFVALTSEELGRKHSADPIVGKHLFVLPNNGASGRQHAAKVVEEISGKAASIKVVELEGLPEKGNTVEYFASGKTLTDLFAAIDATPEYIAPKARFALVSIRELLQRPDPTWLIHGVLQSNTNSCLSAAHASFKSFLTLDMALHVATGRQWCGRDVIQGNVVYVCAEGASGMKARVQAWCYDRSIDPPTNFYFIDDAVQIHQLSDRAAFFASLGDLKPVLIIFDTLSLCALDLEENASKDMNLFMDSVKKIQDETSAHVLLVHHHSKAGGSRGSSAIPAAVQTEFELKRERDSATLTCNKQKDGLEFKPMTFASRVVEYDHWRKKSSLVLDYQGEADQEQALSGAETTVYNLLREVGGASSSKLLTIVKEEKIALTERTVYRALKSLVEKKQVDDGKGGIGGRGAFYRPVELLNCGEKEVTDTVSMSGKVSSVSDEKPHTDLLTSPFRDVSNVSKSSTTNKAVRKSRKKADEVAS